MCRNCLSLQLQRFLGRFRSLPSICKDPAPPAPWQRLKMAELRSRMPSISERELEPPMACDIPNSELSKANRRQRSSFCSGSSEWHGFGEASPAEPEISGRIRCFPQVPQINCCCLRKRNEGLCLKMRALDRSALWLQESTAAQARICTAEGAKQVLGQLKKVPKYSCKDFVCIAEDSMKPEQTPNPLTKQKAEAEVAATICLPAPCACAKSEGTGRCSNVAMTEREEKLLESIKRETSSHWSQQKERRPSKQFEEDFGNLRRWQKNPSNSWIETRNQQQQEKRLQKIRRRHELPQAYEQKHKDSRIKIDAKQKDHLSVTTGEARATQMSAPGVLRPVMSCQELKDIYMCSTKAKNQQNAKENQGKCSTTSAEEKATPMQQRQEKKATADNPKDTAQQICMLETHSKDITGKQAPQRVLSEEQLQLQELQRMSKSINLRELKMIMEMKKKPKQGNCGSKEKTALGIIDKEELSEHDENQGIDSDYDVLALQQIEEISKLCAVLKEKYEKRKKKRIESKTRKKEEEADLCRKFKEAAVEAEAVLRQKKDEACQRRRLLADLKQKRRDIATKQQLLHIKSKQRSMEEKPSGGTENRKKTQPKDRQKLRQVKRMVRQQRLSIAKCTSSSHSLVITPPISKWRKKEVPRGLEDAFGDPFPERLDNVSKLLGKAYPTQPQQPQCHNPATIVPQPTRTSAFGSTIILRKHLSNLKRYGINDALVVYWLRQAAFPLVRNTPDCGTKKADFIYDETRTSTSTTTMTMWPCHTKEENTPNNNGSQ